jgi:ribosomal protein S18 acetylase RimI-like enzyme
MRELLKSVREAGAKGVHLEMHKENVGALVFYQTFGFVEVDVPGVEAAEDPLYLGLTL